MEEEDAEEEEEEDDEDDDDAADEDDDMGGNTFPFLSVFPSNILIARCSCFSRSLAVLNTRLRLYADEDEDEVEEGVTGTPPGAVSEQDIRAARELPMVLLLLLVVL